MSIARQADVIAALSTEALRGTVRHLHPSEYFTLILFSSREFCVLFFQSGLHASRPHLGQNLVAERLRSLLISEVHPSEISKSHANCGRVQDAYSIRCVPQVRFYPMNFLSS